MALTFLGEDSITLVQGAGASTIFTTAPPSNLAMVTVIDASELLAAETLDIIWRQQVSDGGGINPVYRETITGVTGGAGLVLPPMPVVSGYTVRLEGSLTAANDRLIYYQTWTM